jgi:guanylate kinase
MVYILPPSLQELERRLRSRATDSADVIEQRLAKAKEELTHYGLYDYLIVNDDLERAYDFLRAIYRAAQCQIQRHGAVAERLVKEVERSGG